MQDFNFNITSEASHEYDTVFDTERLIGVAGWDGTADLLEALAASTVDAQDYWIVQRAAEIGFNVGRNSVLTPF